MSTDGSDKRSVDIKSGNIKQSGDEVLDPMEALSQLEKLISQTKEFVSNDNKKLTFNDNKLLNDLLDKPISNGNDNDVNKESDGESVDDMNGDLADDEEDLIDEEVSDTDNRDNDKNNSKGLKRTSDNCEEDNNCSDDEDYDNENKVSKPKKKMRSSEKKKKTSTPKAKKRLSNPMKRKNIKDIMNENDLDKDTQLARKEEEERLQRQIERENQRRHELIPNKTDNNFLSFRFAEIPDNDEVLLSSDDERRNESAVHNKSISNQTADSIDIIDLSSGDEDFTPSITPSNGCSGFNNRRVDYENSGISLDYNMVGADDVDDIQIVDNSEMTHNTLEDMNNCGSHTDDTLNAPDVEGRVLVNVGHPTEDSDIFLAPQLSRSVKPHQIGGIRFMYDNIVESLDMFKSSPGFGCILAHSMGLGKTIQVISFIDILLSHTNAKLVLCIVPINTLQNWINEFNIWLPDSTIDKFFQKPGHETPGEVKYRSFKVYDINDAKSTITRAKEILLWRKNGGVLLMGYEMFRILTSNIKQKSKKDEEINPFEFEKMNTAVKESLLTHPDLIVCDEGHRIKNAKAGISQALKLIKTKRRIVLTGYPLQNNLIEYWCMIDFVRPNYLGTRHEFINMFEKPITNGQCIDSTGYDKQLMRYRTHVLYQLLKGFVQRRSHIVLQNALPMKNEYVLMCRMTKLQKDLMMAFMDTAIHDPDSLGTYKGRINILVIFAVCCKIWNHPDIIYDILREGISRDDLDIEAIPTKNNKTNRNKKKNDNNMNNNLDSFIKNGFGLDSNRMKGNNYSNDLMSELFDAPLRTRNEGIIDYSWAEPKLGDYKVGLIENSFKMFLLFEIIKESIALGDRLLIFSQSLMTLDLIERFLQSRTVPNTGNNWIKNVTYYRLDGSTSTHERERYIEKFNKTKDAHLFLISTKAGSLGINLIGANRIVIFDASWNPCHDAQAACRIYRYGQAKPCYIYRLICDNSLEKKMYDRQVNKQGMANRVVDEQNIEANFTWREITELLADLNTIEEPPIEVFTVEQLSKFNDELIKRICRKHNYSITRLPFEHESLFLDRKEQKLNSLEKRMAFRQYDEAKRGKVTNDMLSSPYSLNHTTSNYPPYGLPFGGGGSVKFEPTYNSLPDQITPTPNPFYLNGVNSYPNVSQPLPAYPPQPRNIHFQNFDSIAENMVRSGNTVKKLRVPNDLNISVGLNNSVSIKRGEEVMVIQTPKGLYLRTNEGHIISIKNSQSNAFLSQMPSSMPQSSNSFGVLQPNLQCGGTVHCLPSSLRLTGNSTSTVSHPPEVVQLSDDDDDNDDDDKLQMTNISDNNETQTIDSSTNDPSILSNGSTANLDTYPTAEEINNSMDQFLVSTVDNDDDDECQKYSNDLSFDSLLDEPLDNSSLIDTTSSIDNLMPSHSSHDNSITY
ncbi:helicase ARIP4-like [Oppia nitens]|uniref:helicase ARIP4-like n=1 Tax=Oppia nitens TaxID=1686743 RepID=UPI0023DA0F7E|nr:helicase ARIP4-like [Oppia nitens]